MKARPNDPRRALQVTRYHTWPRLRDQSVGEHSAQVMRILLAIHPEAPRHMLVHCIVHDIGEERTGDPPYPVKRDNPLFKKESDRIEREAHLSMCVPWLLPAPQCLTEDERAIFKLAEFIEMWEWGLYEMNLGNNYARLVVKRCAEGTRLYLRAVPEGIAKRASDYINKRQKMEKANAVTV